MDADDQLLHIPDRVRGRREVQLAAGAEVIVVSVVEPARRVTSRAIPAAFDHPPVERGLADPEIRERLFEVHVDREAEVVSAVAWRARSTTRVHRDERAL